MNIDSFSMLMYLVSALFRPLLANAMGHPSVLSSTSSYGNHKPTLACRHSIPSPTPDAAVSKYRLGSFSLQNHAHHMFDDSFHLFL